MNKGVAIITGAGKGIGRATARELGERGYRLTLVARTKADLDETAKLTRESLVAPCDATHADEVQSVVQKTLDRFGRIDAIVNGAGWAPVRSMEQITIDEWRGILDANLSSAFYLSKAVWPVFKKQGAGVIVNLSSLACRDPFAGLGAYGAAKAGMNLLGLAMAREGAELGIRVHTLALGSVETGMLRAIVSEKDFPKDKTMTPEEVARVIAQCIEGDLRYTSGEVIYLHKTM